MLPRAASEHYLAQTRLSAALQLTARRLWARMPADFDAGWAGIEPLLTTLLLAGQQRSAADASAYVAAVAAQTGLDPARTGTVQAAAFSGQASDGRPLDTLLRQGVVAAKTSVGQGAPVAVALAHGGMVLERIVVTQLADTARAAELVSMAATPAVTGYVRVLTPPSCARCVILAGKRFSWRNDFRRHPRCDCYCLPAGDGTTFQPVAVSPEDYFAGLTRDEQDRVFGKDGAEAIRLGASPIHVVNANRGTYVPAGRRTATPSRRAPVGPLLEQAGGDRDKAVELLRAAGYLT